MNVLIITHVYAPSIDPRAFRWTAISEHWVSQGHGVVVLSGWRTGLSREETRNGVRVYRVGGAIAENIRSLLEKAGDRPGRENRSPSEPLPSRRGILPATNLAASIQSLLTKGLEMIWWPDYAWFWYRPAVRMARVLLSARKYDCLISVSNPFTGHLVGYSVHRRFPSLPWIADAGDPFSFVEEAPRNNRKLYGDLNVRWEKKVFRAAGAVSVTTNGTKERYEKGIPECAGKIIVIPPLLSGPGQEPPAPRIFPEDGKLRLVFVGTLYRAIRNPDFLLQLYEKLLATPLADRLELHFFGNINDCSGCFAPFGELLGGKIFLHGVVSRDVVFRAMREGTVLVNIGNNTSYQLPSKVVEYASFGKPIVNLVKIENDSSVEFFSHYPASLSLLDTGAAPGEDTAGKLGRFVENPPRVDPSSIRDWIENFRVGKIAEEYEELLAVAMGNRKEGG
jgi:glycosyltransferase involved in cell wall biosynthesis